MDNATLTLSIPKRLKREMNDIRGINWSEESRQFLEDRVKRMRTLRKLDELTKNSKLTDEDVIAFGRKVNAGIFQKHSARD